MNIFSFLSFFSFICTLYVAPVPGVAFVPVQEIIVQDTVQLLTSEWVLREHLREDEGAYAPVLPLDSLTLVLFDDQTYKLVRPKHASVEWGKWQVDDDKSLISVQVTNMNGYSTLSTMLGRWRIRKLTPQQLILKPYGAGHQYLVFERAS